MTQECPVLSLDIVFFLALFVLTLYQRHSWCLGVVDMLLYDVTIRLMTVYALSVQKITDASKLCDNYY